MLPVENLKKKLLSRFPTFILKTSSFNERYRLTETFENEDYDDDFLIGLNIFGFIFDFYQMEILW